MLQKNHQNKISSLKEKQVYSFIASAINHTSVRNQIIDCILEKIEMDDFEKNILIELKKGTDNNIKKSILWNQDTKLL